HLTGPHASPSPPAPPLFGQTKGPQPHGPMPVHSGSGGAAHGGQISVPPVPPLPAVPPLVLPPFEPPLLPPELVPPLVAPEEPPDDPPWPPLPPLPALALPPLLVTPPRAPPE